MDAIDILGDLLGNKTGRSGRGTDILNDIFKRGSRKTTGSTKSKPSAQPTPDQIQREAEELENLLNVANDRHGRNKFQPEAQSSNSRPPFSPGHTSSSKSNRLGQRNQIKDDERAIVLARAMINAAKADGSVDAAEQRSFTDQFGNSTRENREFLQREFAAPLDVEGFVRSVPIGMEQQVYTMSLIAIDLDERSELNYLAQLAQGLRLPLEVRKQIHQRLGAPEFY